MKAVRLETEDLNMPLGLGNRAPRFSWNCEGGIAQSAYRIVCFRNRETVWDSGKVSSPKMRYIRYEGKELRSRDRVEWRVTLWDERDMPGEETSGAFEMGLLETGDWKAKWVTGGYAPDPKKRYPVDCFEKRFTAGGEIEKARIYASALGIYDFTLNGTLCDGFRFAPGMTDYRKRIQYQTYDVTALIGRENRIELRLADGWYRGSSAAYGVNNVYGTQTGAMLQLELTYTDGSTELIGTDETWSWSNDGPIRFADLKDGEIVDLRMRPSYSGKAKVMPAPSAPLVASDNVAVKEQECFSPKCLIAKDGTKVYDFGQNIAGIVSFLADAPRGRSMKLTFGEVLDANGRVDLSGIRESRPAGGWTRMSLIKKLLTNSVSGKSDPSPWQQIRLICSGERVLYKTAFSVFGFRYAEVEGSAEPVPGSMRAIAVYSDLEQTGSFRCSHEGINRLVENTRWSMKGNFLDLPTDCPTRERLGWTGDAQIFFNTGAYLMNTAAFFRKWMRDMEDAQKPNGLLPAVLPYQGVPEMYDATGSSVGWADAVYLIPYRFEKRYGDPETLRENWPMIKKYTDYLLGKTEKDGHYEKGVHLGEWLEPEQFRDKVYGARAKHPEECTAYLYLTMMTVAEIAETLGESGYAATLREAGERAKKAYGTYAEQDTDRQAKLVRPLALGLYEGEEKKNAEKRLVQAVESFGYRVGTGFLSTPFLLKVLTDAGETETAYRVLENTQRPGWLGEVLDGATTIWEDWEGKFSRNHYSPGAVCEWLFDTCAGIRVAGENRFTIAPVPGGTLQDAEASYLSPYGLVRAGWKRDGSGIHVSVEIPSNTTAEVILPGGRTIDCGAGSYSFSC